MKKRFLSCIFATVMVAIYIFTFGGCSVEEGYLTFEKEDGEYVVTTCQKEATGTIVIPGEIDGTKVTSIGEEAFKDCVSLEKVVMPDTITTINSYAFSGCSSLSTITVPENVISLGNWAFGDCTGLTEINYNAKTIDSAYNVFASAGQDGNGIAVNFGSNVEKIPSGIFGGDSYYYYSEESNNIINVTTVNFESGSVCKSIGEDAFRYCKNLTYITLPASLEEFDSSAFAYCDSLTGVEFEDPGNWKYIMMSMFYERDMSNPEKNMALFRDRNALPMFKDYD